MNVKMLNAYFDEHQCKFYADMHGEQRDSKRPSAEFDELMRECRVDIEAGVRLEAAEIAQEIADKTFAALRHPEYFDIPMGDEIDAVCATCGIIIVGSTCPLDEGAQSVPCEPVTDYNGGVTNE